MECAAFELLKKELLSPFYLKVALSVKSIIEATNKEFVLHKHGVTVEYFRF